MLRPIRNMVVIKRDKTDDKTPGGILVPETAKEKVTKGVVLAVGPGTRGESVIADMLEEAVNDYSNERIRRMGSRADGVQKLNGDSLAETVRMAVEGLRRLAPQLKEGDHVLFGKYTGNEALVKDRIGKEHECILTQDDQVYGVIES